VIQRKGTKRRGDKVEGGSLLLLSQRKKNIIFLRQSLNCMFIKKFVKGYAGENPVKKGGGG